MRIGPLRDTVGVADCLVAYPIAVLSDALRRKPHSIRDISMPALPFQASAMKHVSRYRAIACMIHPARDMLQAFIRGSYGRDSSRVAPTNNFLHEVHKRCTMAARQSSSSRSILSTLGGSWLYEINHWTKHDPKSFRLYLPPQCPASCSRNHSTMGG